MKLSVNWRVPSPRQEIVLCPIARGRQGNRAPEFLFFQQACLGARLLLCRDGEPTRGQWQETQDANLEDRSAEVTNKRRREHVADFEHISLVTEDAPSVRPF